VGEFYCEAAAGLDLTGFDSGMMEAAPAELADRNLVAGMGKGWNWSMLPEASLHLKALELWTVHLHCVA